MDENQKSFWKQYNDEKAERERDEAAHNGGDNYNDGGSD